jgi:hypothetical protein
MCYNKTRMGARNMKRFLTTLIVVTSGAALSACSFMPGKKHENHGPPQIIYSPAGDPLNGGPLGRPTCPEAMKSWFMRADANHDNVVTIDEFLADAKTQFQRMDIDKNGYLVSEELERFRMAYRDEPANDKPAAADGNEQSSGGEHHGKRHGGDGENASGRGGNTGSVIDPVMSADVNLDYKVSPDEFISYERKSFKSLNAANDGKLTLAEVAKSQCGTEAHEEH